MSAQTSTDAAAAPRRAETALLRLATAGSVDDGKSTLVGRLLHDCRAVLADQLAAVERASRDIGLAGPDLALLTDGLRAEREQGITIDVAYRYFATGERRFILADTPGHVQYTRNMVTGASTAHLAVILVDARHGIAEQTRRHAAVAALLRVPHLVLAVNKMDLVGHQEAVFAAITADFHEHAARLAEWSRHRFAGVAIPVSALHGTNVVDRSGSPDWYRGPTLLEHLLSVDADDPDASAPARFPVQCVIRPRTGERRDYRGYAGRLESGTLRVGQEVVVLPSGQRSTIAGLDRLGVPVGRADSGQSLTVLLADDLDVSRGDLIAPADAAPVPTRELVAKVCHVADRPLHPGDRVLLKHTTRTVRAAVTELRELLDIGTLTRTESPARLAANDIAAVTVRCAEPVSVDAYAVNRRTGAFLLIDEADGSTLAAGMVDGG